MNTTATYDLRGWKAIAEYLGVDVTTAIKWARSCDLPVFQPKQRGGVYSSKAELDAWSKKRRYNLRKNGGQNEVF